MRATLGLAPAHDPWERRHVVIARAVLSALAARGVSLLVSLVSVPLTIRYLGAERYGAWMVILSILGWLSVSDLGVANHLTNELSAAYGRRDPDSARCAISTAGIVLCCVAIALLVLGVPAWSFAPWGDWMRLRSPDAAAEVGHAMLVAFVLFCAGLPLTALDRIYASIQRGATANAWSAAATLASLIGIVATIQTRGGLVAIVAATAGIPFAVRVVNAAWLFAREYPELRPRLADLTRERASRFVARGGEFFVIQIGALVLFSTDNIVIGRVLGAEQVVPYSVSWQLFAIPTLLQTLAFSYLWPAYAEAISRGDHAWVVRTLRLSMAAGTGLAAALAVPLLAFGQPLIRAWAGPAAVPSMAVLAWMTAWALVLAPANAMTCLLNAAGRVRWQMVVAVISIPANLLVSIWWAREFGVAGVIAATVVTYVAIALTPVYVLTTRVARGLGGTPAGTAPAEPSGA